jgi:mannose-1-phosphate guanylyltransferase
VSPRPSNVWVVILAGGDGRRLGALTTDADGLSTPKQYCSLNGGPSLLQLALQRALAVTSRDRIACVVNEAHRRWWEPQLFWLRRSTVVVQPANRGTGLGVLLPLLVIAKSDPRATVLCVPSDHYVEHEDVLAECLRQATAPAAFESDKITLLGVSPNAPDSGFGYLQPPADSGVGMRPVHRFVEKPEETLAAELIRTGSLWSTGIFAARIARIIELYARHVPGLMLDLKSVVEYWDDTRSTSTELASVYTRHPPIDFSSDVLQTNPGSLQMLALPPCGWSDVGTPSRLAKVLWSLRSPVLKDMSAGRTFNLATAFDRVTGAAPGSALPRAVGNPRMNAPGANNHGSVT